MQFGQYPWETSASLAVRSPHSIPHNKHLYFNILAQPPKGSPDRSDSGVTADFISKYGMNSCRQLIPLGFNNPRERDNKFWQPIQPKRFQKMT
jgi:hypothetical protein